MTLRRAVVLGAGVMGSQIAAHLANAGVATVLLDLGDLAHQAKERLRRWEPAPLFLPEVDRLITPGDVERDLEQVAQADWVIEAVVEDLPTKQALLHRVGASWRPGTIITTNTSGLPVGRIGEALPEAARRHFLGAHFFNPPRYMRLLELIPTPATDPAVTATVAAWGDRRLGKGIVYAKDTPNFIANRIGTFAFLRAVHLMLALGLTVEEVDAVTGPFLGRRGATFRTADLVGLDVALAVAAHSYAHLPHDEARETFRAPAPLEEMVRRGWLGEKTGGGFYRRTEAGVEALDLATLTYRPRRRPQVGWVEAVRELPLADRLRAAMAAEDALGRFVWTLVRDALVYAARRIPEVSDDVVNVDRAMRWGFNWEEGPFETWDLLGVAAVAERLDAEGVPLPPLVEDVLRRGEGRFYRDDPAGRAAFDPATATYRPVSEPPGVLRLGAVRRTGRVLAQNADASLLDLGEGIAAVALHGKLNLIGLGTLEVLAAGLDRLEREFEALVIGTDAADFSAGANLALLLMEAQEGNWEELDLALRTFQDLLQRVRHHPKPVVAAVAGRTLAGGAEMAMACPRVVAAAETYLGLVETGVGLIPAGTGTMEVVRRLSRRIPADVTLDLLPLLRWAFETVARARVSRSALEARELGYLREADLVTMNPDRVVADAREVARSLVQLGYHGEPPAPVRVAGQRGRAALESLLYILKTGGHITAYDEVVGRRLAYVMTGGDVPEGSWVSEAYLLELEREAFLSLLGEARTQERIRHLLQTGRPLRN
ncbi:MAG: 3-hydroxyacyl-CoA dehydrogenase/enoyl-CoA hydratase family protein [Armatimonadota bacterium]|nr:3-hydroxyacyl-CoA dehydrogenase/enoyl-CoA hydratase family protein [Armatimonadota bacterium]